MDTVNQRLGTFIDSLGISNKDFGDLIGKSKSEINNWLNVGVKIPVPTISAIIILYKNLDARWLMTGEGEMLIKTETEKVVFKTPAETVKMDVVGENYERKCPVCVIKDKLILSYENQIKLLERQLPEPEVKKENLLASSLQTGS